MEKTDIVIIGAGPYGLSAAAHLRQRNSAEIRLFGETMSFWERHMPSEMHLRSPWDGSHIADPENRLTLDVYRKANGNHRLAFPIPLQDFINYGHWFHKQAGLGADRRKVIRVEQAVEGYELTLEDGASLRAQRVVVASGIQPFVYRPKVFEGLPTALVTHTSDHHDFASFRGKEVFVIGAGQSALEAAVLLHAAGARVEVLVRNSVVHWLGGRLSQCLRAKPISWMFYGKGEVGPPGISLLTQHPNFFRRLPRALQTRLARRAIRPAVAERVVSRATVRDIVVHTTRFPIQARVARDRIRIHLNDGTERVVDHVILGTGYRVDITQYPFLSSALLKKLDIVGGYPRLADGFESSLPGLHFLGAPAAWSFGPLMRFVAGTEFTARSLTQRVLALARSSVVQGYSEHYPQPNSAGAER